MKKGLPIRNITTDPMGGELRHRAVEYMKSIGYDARLIGDDALIKAVNVTWPDGTEVVVYCHKEDREIVGREVESKGCKIATFVDVDDYWLGGLVVKRGQYIMAKKVEHQWDNAHRRRSYIYDPHETMLLTNSWIWDRLFKEL